MADVITPLVHGAISVGQSLFNHNLAEKSADKQYQRQLDFWNKQNAYNSPSAQRQRFQEAGINPASATGQMATSGTAQGLSSVPGNEYAQQGALKLDGLVSVLETLARIENLGADTGLKGSQMITEALRQTLIGMGFDEKRVDILIKGYVANSKKIELENLPEFFRHRNFMYDLDEKYRSAEIEHENALKSLADAQTDESKESAKKLVAETGLAEIKADTERSIQELNYELSRKSNIEGIAAKESAIRERVLFPIKKRALELANKLSVDEHQLRQIENALADMDKNLHIDENGDPTTWAYIEERLKTIGEVVGVAFIPSVGGLSQLGKMFKPAKKIGF